MMIMMMKGSRDFREMDSFRCLALIPKIASNVLILDFYFPKSLMMVLESLWMLIQANLQSQLEVSRREAMLRGLKHWASAGTEEVVQAMYSYP